MKELEETDIPGRRSARTMFAVCDVKSIDDKDFDVLGLLLILDQTNNRLTTIATYWISCLDAAEE